MNNRNIRFSAGFLRSTAVAVFALLGLLSATGSAQAAECRSDAKDGIDWSNCKKRLLMLDHSHLDGANLSGADFSMTDLSGTSLRKADLTKANLVRASLAGASAEGANFEKAEGYRSNMSGILAAGASFLSSEMQRSNFSDADLRKADFTKAELGRAVFVKTRLENTKFSMANLSRATFNHATISGPVDFTNAFLFLTRIEGVDLSTATGLTQEQVALSCGDDGTKLPAGLQKPQQWPCQDD